MTSRWVRLVQAQRDYSVDWRFISLRLVNADVDYDARFPPEYEAGHTAGLRLLRGAARTPAGHGPAAVGTLYEAPGQRPFGSPPAPEGSAARPGTPALPHPPLASAGLPAALADALDDAPLDAVVQSETDEALALTGREGGPPITHARPPAGVAFFGPVI